ncbi:hypothetical protein GCM10010260_16820 [Streptomyces filipinensis]|uniref:Uncharacterized protein n=1 Tax=Streptomyces filipinensis TaxID=66887 RepID=A0A918I7H2_9ACTN|nr:DUF6284 family protein [Streptomyces filipinensis]GGU84402.1 hypothetical protein GCM10010260_16820 [Streptomyces filipinensis]
MKILSLSVSSAIDADELDREPTAAELCAIVAETPLIEAEVELLDVRIALMDRTPSELDKRRLRKALHRVLTARAALANRAVSGEAA